MTEAEKRLNANSKKLRQLVNDYCSTQRNPSLPRFLVHGPFTLDEVWKSDASKKPGCYAIYFEDGSPPYIGMSETKVGDRIAKHFSTKVQRSSFWHSPARHVDLIEVTQPWEAPSLRVNLKVGTTGLGAQRNQQSDS